MSLPGTVTRADTTATLQDDGTHPKTLLSSFKNLSTASVFSDKKHTVHDTLTALAHDVSAYKKHGNPPFADVQSLAERVWRANLEYESAIAKLNREKEKLTTQVNKIWKSFDTLIRPLWRVDDAIVPIYDELAELLLKLEELHDLQKEYLSKNESTMTIDRDLVVIQNRLHEIEELHVNDGKFVTEGFKNGDKVPSGQAMLANLLSRCYRYVRSIQETEPTVNTGLFPIQTRLESIVAALQSLKASLAAHNEGASDATVDPLEVTTIQTHLDAIHDEQVDNKFVDADGNIPEGQAILHSLMEEAYDLVHECLVEIDQREIYDQIVDEKTNALIARVQEVVANAERDAADAAHAAYATLSEGYTALKASASTAALTAESSKFATLVRSGFAAMGRAMGVVEQPVDKTLEPVLQKLTTLKQALIRIRNERDRREVERLKRGVAAMEREEGYEMRAHLVELETLDAGRDDMGNFLNSEGGAPADGQQQLKALLEECFVLAYELL